MYNVSFIFLKLSNMKFARSQRTIRLWTDSAVHLVRIHCSISKDMSLPDDCHVLCTSENLCNTSCTHLAAFLKHQQRLTSKQIESVLEGIAGLYPFDTDQREREREVQTFILQKLDSSGA